VVRCSISGASVLKERIAKENQLEASTKAQEVEKQAKERMDKLSQAAKGLNDKPGCFKTYNVGAALIRKVWSDLKLPEMFRHLQRSRKIGYSYDHLSLTPKSLGPQSAFGFN